MARKKGKGAKKAGQVKRTRKVKRGRRARGAKFSSLVQTSLDKLRSDAETLALETYIGNLSRLSDKTLGQFLKAITKDGAEDTLMKIEMSRIASAMRGAPVKGKRGRKKAAAAAAGGRLSKEEMAKLKGTILEYIKEHPDCKRKDIAKNLNLPTKKLFSAMKSLLADGTLATKGKKAGMTYSVKKG